MLIFDGDYPMAYGGVELNRDLTLPLAEVRVADGDSGNVAFACLPEMRRGRVAAALSSGNACRVRPGQRIKRVGQSIEARALPLTIS